MNKPAVRILVADDDASIRRPLTQLLVREGYEVHEAADGLDAVDKLAQRRFQLLITDLRMPGLDGLGVLRTLRERRFSTLAIMMTGHGSIPECVEAMKAGAIDFIHKPFDPGEIVRIVRAALACRAGEPRGDHPQVALVGDSPALQAVLRTVDRLAHSDVTVLITGETGSGKEVIARLLHGNSPRASGPFVAVNCGAIPEGLVESELFGHARGAFTGAVERQLGKFQQANGGTLFLDEIGDLPMAVQVKLLRAIQERVVTPVGDSRGQAVDLRIIAATHRNLREMAEAGSFRQDLFYRLNVVSVTVPALRQRREDVPALAEYFLDAAARRLERTLQLTPAAMAAMQRYAWPGNVRELENVIERLAVLCPKDSIEVADLPAEMQDGPPEPQVAAPHSPLPSVDPGTPVRLFEELARYENQLIDDALRFYQGNKSGAARALGLNRTTLVEKLRRRQAAR